MYFLKGCFIIAVLSAFIVMCLHFSIMPWVELSMPSVLGVFGLFIVGLVVKIAWSKP